MADSVMVPFHGTGTGSGVGELSWGQRELWGGMVRHPNDLDSLLERVSRERGEQVDIACYLNDRKPPGSASAEPLPAADEVRAALAGTAFRWMSKQDRPSERLFLTLEDNPDLVELDICGGTQHIPPSALEACVRTMEAVTVEAATALDPANRP